MTEKFSPDEPKRLLTELCLLARDRAAAEKKIGDDRIAASEDARRRRQESQQSLAARHRKDKENAEKEYASAKSEVRARSESDIRHLHVEYNTVRTEALARYEADSKAAQKLLTDGRWEVTAMSEAARSGSNLQVKDIVSGLETRWQELQTLHRQAVELLEHRGQWEEMPPPQPVPILLESHPSQRFMRAIEVARAQYRDLSKQFMYRFTQGLAPLGIFLLIWAFFIFPAHLVFDEWKDWRWAAASGATAFIVILIAGIATYRVTENRAVEAYTALRRTLLEAGFNQPAVLETAIRQSQQLLDAIDSRQTTELKKVEERFAVLSAEIQERKQREVQQADEFYPAKLTELAEQRDRLLRELDEKYVPYLADLDAQIEVEKKRIDADCERAIHENEERCDRALAEATQRWFLGRERFQNAVTKIETSCQELFPDWNSPDWSRWTPPQEIPNAVRFGSGKIELAKIESGVADSNNPPAEQNSFTLPMLLPFPNQSLLLWKAKSGGMAGAIMSMQAAMLRLLTALPPGMVRFTIVDPVGLGENFSAFMHLADFDEKLIASRIWTDTSHIEQRLADLTKHMENVIQVYLRNEFHSIQEYNAFAGEMAEPYRVLVIANFPAHFSEAAAQRLRSIVSSGARCGVFTLMSVEENAPLVSHYHLSDMEAEALVLQEEGSEFVWRHPNYGPVPLVLDAPPPAETFREIVRTVGDLAKDAGRVEVPFSCIIPPEEEWWTADSRTGIDVPLGRAGALKLQNLKLGSGTSQHVLISGKTGSGKSTLLHVLITNLAIRYSPDEVELYLIDFKKGVEFKAYANIALPHARVIAIESEREFGLSVLQRLDAELRHRGDLFRKQNVQDLKSFRTECPDEHMPRILLIIDEFQELFVDDDRIAQEASLLLDRLVRQGRAFGIHVLLGSQTLGGAYSLARSTLGQMAVRIALQCSESDAHLILSEDNTAARLLSRPGEAIYNDANGLYEGNHPFQVVWLNDDERDGYLEKLRHLETKKKHAVEPPIVFEGNIPADPNDNAGLKSLIAAPTWPESCPTPLAWLGAAVAIKDPTAATLLRQNGSNLLLVGHREEAALGILATGMIGLAAQFSPHVPDGEKNALKGAKFYVLDGIRADAPEVGLWDRVAAALPHAVKIVQPRGSAEVLAEIAAELAVRQENPEEHAPPLFLFLYNLARFRDLRKDDDFSFSSFDDGKGAAPAKQFSSILREGPSVGIHTLVWCDTYSNVSRFLDRQNMRDFELRVLFQMNANDSSNLMDTPEASRLGVHVAVMYDEGQGSTEKFRPYGMPSADWLAWVKGRFAARKII